jgi:diguanylate cyclase (GGDEF)-like protein
MSEDAKFPEDDKDIKLPVIGDTIIRLAEQRDTALDERDAALKRTEQLHGEATHDSLTGAFNRGGLKEYIKSRGEPDAVLIIDATNFKAVNSKYGYPFGDAIIKDIHGMLRRSVRSNDVIARWGGDEFIVAIYNRNQQLSFDDKPEDENRRTDDMTPEELIEVAKKRIAEVVQEYDNESRLRDEVNFDLSVGGMPWKRGHDIDDHIAEVEEIMKKHKAEQHARGGSYR